MAARLASTCVLSMQMDQEADDETKDWLDNMMSNSVSVKKGSGLVAASKLSGAHKSLQRREHADNRAMRKTLILRTGTTDMTEEVLSAVLAPESLRKDSVLTTSNTVYS